MAVFAMCAAAFLFGSVATAPVIWWLTDVDEYAAYGGRLIW